MEIEQALLVGIPLVVSSLSLTAMHFFPWNRGAHPLKATSAYALGTLVTVGVPASTMALAAALNAPQDETFWVALLVANTAVSGATVHLCYWVDEGRAVGRDEVGHARR